MFPNNILNPEDKVAMALTRAVVLENSDDLSIVFDTNNVIDKSVELNKDGIDEHDGILILKENYFCDDGAYMVVRIIIEMVRMKLEGSNEGIESLIKDLKEPLESAELRMDVMSEPKHAKAKADEVIKTFKN
ncbi:hypothetical protein POM88_031230 [Heracleum sosnowskyi]|uniref:Uncharacterized protein n=1 Tax=Heracleum sosnowskyi TaxID=360622 RepID=A0AAD8HX04_9APIA|nr:hypothetical protein POM88_031230 [Heracleum sosnowskyi]